MTDSSRRKANHRHGFSHVIGLGRSTCRSTPHSVVPPILGFELKANVLDLGVRGGSSPARQQILNRLWDLGRSISTQTVFVHQAIAQSVGLNLD